MAVDFASAYLRVRQLEGRLYPDEVVARLPYVPRSHPLWAEWRLRAESARRLCEYLAKKEGGRLLDFGCGNGWLSSQLATLPKFFVWGVDRNRVELEQARRVFRTNRRLARVEGDMECPPFAGGSFDVIVVASAIQYVADLPALVARLFAWLRPTGELHILDSPLYAVAEVEAARARTDAYYKRLGVPEMTAYYHHHTYDELMDFSPMFLNDPRRLMAQVKRRLGLAESPFPWLWFRL